jgi:Tropinone reductase 1
VNNAAAVVSKNSTKVTAEDMANTLGTNVEASYHLCQLAHPLLKASGNGSIVFISSVAAVVALPTLSFYGASKGEEDLYVSAAVLMSKFYFFLSQKVVV